MFIVDASGFVLDLYHSMITAFYLIKFLMQPLHWKKSFSRYAFSFVPGSRRSAHNDEEV